jgi:hypothetical protein
MRAILALAFVAFACAPAPAEAQRALHWQRVEVDATLDATGTLHIVETQAMEFTGDWNGGERTFDVRPWQSLSFEEIRRQSSGAWRHLTADSDIDDVDEYGWTDDRTLRWRSRMPHDPPFSRTVLTYQLRYSLGGVLLKSEAGYTLDHDFLFPERAGIVERFSLRLALAPEWSSSAPIRREYRATGLSPGYGYVLTLPLTYSGSDPPAALPMGRPDAVSRATGALAGAATLLLLWFFGREQWYGRFAPLADGVDEAWLKANIFTLPAEVVGAAWDETMVPPRSSRSLPGCRPKAS